VLDDVEKQFAHQVEEQHAHCFARNGKGA